MPLFTRRQAIQASMAALLAAPEVGLAAEGLTIKVYRASRDSLERPCFSLASAPPC
jgi:hypothetical protein